MAKATITHACGHTATVRLIGPSRSRESRIASLEREECFECFNQHSTKVARQQAEMLELPPLVGTERQVAWAETLRIRILTDIEREAESLHAHKHVAQILLAVDAISDETSAKQWIEWRDDTPRRIIEKKLNALLAAPTAAQQQAEREAKAQAEAAQHAALVEATIRPEVPVSEVAAEIHRDGSVISVRFPEMHDGFNEVVRSLGYTWKRTERLWQRTINGFAGTPVDRATELGQTLIAHGFLVRAFDEDLRTRIVSGTFEPEHTRWVSKMIKGEYAGWLAIRWGRDEDYYAAARKIKESKYSSPRVVVPPAQYEQLLDFAHTHDFRLSQAAQDAISQAQADKAAMLVAPKKPVARRKKTPAPPETPPVLAIPSEVEIADEFKDND